MLNIFKKKADKETEKNEKGIQKFVDIINVKSSYGAKFNELSEVEQNIYLNHMFEVEIENGGFGMLFFHPSGDFAFQMLDSLKAIGAVKSAQLLQEAIAKFPKDIKHSKQEERQDLLEEIDADDELFLELNEALQAMGENLAVYQKAYILKHKDELVK